MTMDAKNTTTGSGDNASPDSADGQTAPAMSKREARLLAVLDTMAEGVVLVARDGQIVEANAPAARILGLARSQITGRNYLSWEWKTLRPDGTPMPPEEAAGPRAMNEKRRIEDVVMGLERPDGTVVWIRGNASPVVNLSGEVEGVVATFADITESWRAEQKHKMILDTALDGFGIIDLDGRPLEFNDSYCRMVGYTLEELLTMSIGDIVAAETPEETAQRLKKLREQGYDRFESRHRRKDGTFIDVEISANYFAAGEGQIVVFVRDVTERKRAEQAIAESEGQYRMLVENIPQRVFLKDRNSVYISCNSRYAEDMGIGLEKIWGHTDFDFYPADMAEKYRADDRRVMESGHPERIEENYIEHGQKRVVETFKTPIRDAGGEVVGVLGVFEDITKRKRTEEALRQSEERYRELTNSAGEAILVIQDGLIRFINPKVEEISGYSAEELLCVDFARFIHPADADMVVDRYQRRLRREAVPQRYDFRIARKDGIVRWAELSAVVISWEGGPAVLCLISDITERKSGEEALRQSEERYRVIAENTSDSIWVLDGDLRLTYQSPSTERMFGYTLEEWMRVGWKGFVHPEDLHIVMNAITGFRDDRLKDSARGTIRVFDRDGHEMWAEVVCSPVHGPGGQFCGVVGVTRDISERVSFEQQLLEYKTAVEQAADGIAVADLEGYILFVNEAWAEMHGHSVEEVKGKHLKVFHSRKQLYSEVMPFNRCLLERGTNSGEVGHVRKDGREFPTFMTTAVLSMRGQPYAMMAVMRDITEQKAAERRRREQEIAQARAEELDESRRRLINAQEALRRDIAGKLHGTVQNRLILLGHKLAELEEVTTSETMARELADVRGKLEELQDEHIRPISHRLFPSILRLGLCVGLEALADEYGVELPIDLQVSKQIRAREQATRRLIPNNIKLALYRIAEEALANILRHSAGVTNTVVKLSLSRGGMLRLTVNDDGAGFDEASTAAGIGLAMMSDYAAAAGGNCVVKSIPGKGTRVRAEVPLPEPEAGQ
jgi:PAS domain S-box-containing protein